jgi:hypothetical protein
MLRTTCTQACTAVRWTTVMVMLVIGLALNSLAADVFRVGDLLVAQNNGQYQFIRVTGSGNTATFQVIDNLSDLTGNNTAGCTFTPMFRPVTVSYATGVAPSAIERYQVSDVGTAHPVIVSSDTSSTGGLSGKSVAMDAQSSIYLAHSAGTGEIDQYIQPGPAATQTGGALSFGLGARFPIGANVDTAGSEWLDVTSIAATEPTVGMPYVGYNNDLYYTSAGLNVYLLTFTTNPQNSPPPSSFNIQKLSINLLNFKIPAGFAYHGVKILSDASGNPTALIVAAGPKLVLLSLSSSTGATLSTVYDYSKKAKNASNWQSVAVDTAGTGFWATDQGNKNLAHFPIVFSGNPNKFITSSPDTTLTLATTPFGVCMDGSFSPGQPKRQNVGTATLTTTAPTFTFNIPNLYPSFYPTQTSPNTFTVGATFTPPTASAQATLYSLDFDPTNNEGVSEDQIGTTGTYGLACLKTAPPPPLNTLSPYCETYKAETTPSVGQGISLLDLDIFVLQQTTSSFATPPAAPGPQPFGTTPESYHDGSLQLTEGILQDETRIKSGTGGTGSTVFTIQNQLNTEGISCGYQPPFAPLSTDPTNAPVFSSGSTIGLKFQAAIFANPVNCQNQQSGGFLSDLMPELKVLKLNSGNLASSTDVTSQFTNAGCSNQCTGLLYAPSGSQGNTTWNLQVKGPTGSGVSGTYIAFTTDLNKHIPDFSAYFCLDVCSAP